MAKFLSFTATIITSLLLLLSGCMNNVEDISSVIIINPADVSFSEDIQPIISSSCGGSGCHIPNTINGVNLSSYDNIINSIGIQYGTNIVVPGNPEASPMIDKINPDPQFGQRMPLTGGYLTAEEIALIEAWIEGGAEDN